MKAWLMAGTIPDKPKIYHIVHLDRLASIIQTNGLLSDAKVRASKASGTTIGYSSLKDKRLTKRKIPFKKSSLFVGECVPFYFCPRCEMLYIFNMNNSPRLTYDGGQKPIIHLEVKLKKAKKWAESEERKWAFSLRNATSKYCEFRYDLNQLNEINWDAVTAKYWQDCSDEKQAEFLVEEFFPWELVSKIGVYSQTQLTEVNQILTKLDPTHKPKVEIKRAWYY